MNATEILKLIEDIAITGSRIAKETILRQEIEDPLLQRILKATYDPFVTYGLNIERIETKGELDISDPIIWEVLHNLSVRFLTGNEARDTVRELIAVCSPATAELLWRILSHDMRAGFSANTLNKVMPGLIPTFEVMLAHKYEEKRIKKFPVWGEPKLDGLRTICIYQNGDAKFYSRSGKEFTALASLASHVREWMSAIDVDSCVLEGEAISGEFAETSGSVRRKSEQANKTEYHVFDYFPIAVLIENWPYMEFTARRETLKWISTKIPKNSPIRLVPGRQLHSHDEIADFYNECRSTKLSDYLGWGDFGDKVLEGAIIKTLEGFYEKKRSFSWLKMKAEETEDLRVIANFEGQGKYVGSLGGLIVKRPFKDGFVEVRVGGGFSDDLRQRIWSGEEPALGRLIEIEYHEETPDGSLRHPRFLRFRDDKDTGND